MENDVKSALTSQTIWSDLLTLASVGAGWLGYSFSSQEQATTVAACTGIATAVFALMGVFGRVKATKPINGVVTAKQPPAPANPAP